MNASGAHETAVEALHYRFGDVVVDPDAHTLIRGGQIEALEPKAFAVLLQLLYRRGELVRHDDLLDAVWGHRHVTLGVLTRAIAQLRQALGDDSRNPIYIQTQHGLGYRFIGEFLPEPEPEAPFAASRIDHGSIEPAAIAQRSAVPPASMASPTHRRLRRVWLPAALLLPALAVAMVWAWRQHTPSKTTLSDASIAVMPFVSLSSHRDDSYFAEGLAVEIHDALAGVPGVRVAACRSDTACGARGADIKQIGRLLGVAAVLNADVRRERQRLRISARLIDTRSGFTVWAGQYDRPMTDVFALQSEIATRVVESLPGVLPNEGENLATRLTPTRDVTAFDAYLRGLHAQAKDADADRAIGFFNEALAADNKFAHAQAAGCRAEVSRFETRRDPDAFQRAKRACARAEQMDPHLSETKLAWAELHHVRGDIGKAVEYYMQAEVDPARRPAAYVGLAITHAGQGRYAQSRDYFKRARALRPGDYTIHSVEGYYQYLAGDVPAAIASYRKAIELKPRDADLWNMLGWMHMIAGNDTAAASALAASIGIRPNYAALSNLGELKYRAGDYTDAAALQRRAIALEPNDFLPWGYLATALQANSATAGQARAAYLEAAARGQRYVAIKSDDAMALAALGWYRANLGQLTQARELVGRSEALGSAGPEAALFNAQTWATLGEIDQARRLTSAARAAGMTEKAISASPVLRRAGIAAPVRQAANENTPGG